MEGMAGEKTRIGVNFERNICEDASGKRKETFLESEPKDILGGYQVSGSPRALRISVNIKYQEVNENRL